MPIDWKLEVDASEVASKFGALKAEVEEAIIKGVGVLALTTHQRGMDYADQELPQSLAPIYKEALTMQHLAGNVHLITLDMKSAGWLEEGRKCILYSKNKNGIPHILTPDGNIPIDKVKIGMMVLNQFGKWTTVEEIYDEHIVQKSKMIFTKVEKSNYTPDKKRFHKRVNIDCVIGKCPVCEHTVKYEKWKKTYDTDGIFCQKCLERERIVTIETPAKFRTGKLSKNRNKLSLTGDHKVMTQRGWVEAWDLQESDSLQVPSWSNCKTCDQKTYLGLDFCYCKKGSPCSAAYHIQKTFEKGTHQSQQPGSRGKYLEVLQKLQKSNKTEEEFEKQSLLFGYTTAIYTKDIDVNEYDFIREYPVQVESDGTYSTKYYFIDFFCPRLNIGFEVDGKGFHSTLRDSPRDQLIRNAIGCDIVRIPAKNVWKKDFFKTNIEVILDNHSGNIEYISLHGYKIKKEYLKTYSSMCHRWDITVAEGESFVCNGLLIHNSGFMEELLHGKSSHQGKNGRYAIIPLKHNKKNIKDHSMKTQELMGQIKSFLKEKKIPSTKLEFNPDGSPKMGLLHRFNVDSAKPSEKAKYPALSGLAIYQRNVEDKKSGKTSVKKEIMTFRVISESMKGDGRWIHPGSKAYQIIDKIYFEALGRWDNEILPSILNSFK